ncbi:hypothetical protein CU102_26635 [Phyllobacterium brassicacearum]|uniref:SPOR domain-containing protein n=1 Tax=Phyllobacterium brassicacearum TaxID=314235 RepID=A0A2P7B5G5_9HYPH|nr:hypothetical protein [Phyllobacterium brassicacearum]PSH61693.1 hypothetical protein CU102_26635 [Phyllobacterium brassicacearum]TDQ14568.1 hypothetical protein DEV91_13811 [Phyllobacterium brassicacearum]
MKPQMRPFTVEIKQSRRNQKSSAQSIWSDIDLSAYQSSESVPESSTNKPEIPATPVTDEIEANDMIVDKTLTREPSAPSSVGIVKSSGLHYVQVHNNGTQHALIGPFRTRELAQGEAAKWVARCQSESQR